jgi:mono/diheme cytochrome c family protein
MDDDDRKPVTIGPTRKLYMKALKILAAVLIAGIVLLAVAVYAGTFDVAADTPHSRVVYRFLETMRDRSIDARSAGVDIPPLSDPKMIAEGAEHYAQMCTGCHLAPGMRDSEIRPGLYPQPPDLTQPPPPSPARAFWVVKHGIKMTAMPAWGTTHSDAAIWNIVAFLQRLPTLTPEQYRSLGGGKEGSDHDSDEGDHEHTGRVHAEPGAREGAP